MHNTTLSNVYLDCKESTLPLEWFFTRRRIFFVLFNLSWFSNELVHAHVLVVFGKNGPPLLVDCLSLPLVCYEKIALGNKFLFISFFLVFLCVFGVADADFDVSFCIVSTVLKIFATD